MLPESVTANGSQCGNDSSLLKIDFGKGHSWALSFKRDNQTYKVDNISFTYDLKDDTIFKNSSSNGEELVPGGFGCDSQFGVGGVTCPHALLLFFRHENGDGRREDGGRGSQQHLYLQESGDPGQWAGTAGVLERVSAGFHKQRDAQQKWYDPPPPPTSCAGIQGYTCSSAYSLFIFTSPPLPVATICSADLPTTTPPTTTTITPKPTTTPKPTPLPQPSTGTYQLNGTSNGTACLLVVVGLQLRYKESKVCGRRDGVVVDVMGSLFRSDDESQLHPSHF